MSFADLDWGLLLVRAVCGVIYIAHGWSKVFGDLVDQGKKFGKLGLPMPYYSSLLTGVVEVGGGLLLLAGLFTRPLAVILALTMVVAIWKVKWKKGFVHETDFPLLLLVVQVLFLLTGAGALALDRLWFGS